MSSKEYDKFISIIEGDYKKVCAMHQQYKDNLKNYSNDEILLFNHKSNTFVKDLKRDFDYFEREYNKIFNQLKFRIGKYYSVLDDYDDINDYKSAIVDCVYMLVFFIDNHNQFISPVQIEGNLINMEKYIDMVGKLIKDFGKFLKELN